ncbi:aminoacyl-tRNA hydrolase [Candidatus Palibaumannia cicadellinicola]|uniref:Peptidyl-tRNA hydrolase n=1 Tax=Baumannia cicadellinicola subsp. Homalodisca coagulata TaxID=374463 RepID=PTH_BAUCH|nr:aminoacyl-tRNA hydrolase [Candidatus Baumannia cicadellinicola]Q1LTH1.1 RecName: Full=Peptidyl-tRNA hydrolase; Short=PTH [Baumannia cicadellinicola str. Hc (Homalodisca coagulata)]ABF13958.1 peptidyl-tRNA hydrolase [Baumannia cicadellinicola str. Hc (Homalodisca coagulata)]MBS0032731.1 aminoacyl-tRNA hydrolase [Candidatus Baumannia cicadellinicola]MCJ7462274.1 aminoacyl-tRNA hydrolase [Candidatus Baumannia cicadellinicola]MCJ7462608.1 aminoacyl-tRNA hydrolase [Candidatus Baumannia cicadelli
MTIKLIVGLANPGNKYLLTRHNVGSWYVNQLANNYHVSLINKSSFLGYTGYLNIGKRRIFLLIPTIFMNYNGQAVAAIAKFYNIMPEEILIAHDELNFLPGYARFKYSGGHGGHNGLKDVIYRLGDNNNFYRLRIGIGHPGDKNKVIKFVLDTPLDTEQQLIQHAINESVLCTSLMFQQNIAYAIHQLHTILK